MPAMIVGYTRVHAHDVSLLTQQRAALRAAGCETIYVDRGAGRRLPQLTRAVKRLGRGDVLVVQKLDRLGRGLGELVDSVRAIEARAAHLRSLDDALDTSAAVTVFQVMAIFAAADRSQRGERARHGVTAAKQRGKPLGRPLKLSSAQVRAADERIDAGDSAVEVARSFGVSPLTLRRALAQLQSPRLGSQQERSV
jgi:DNA invertase Pin-like site-specific DNA recombinase